MSLSDPIADMLTRIRNASRADKKDVIVKSSNICKGIAEVLKKEGYIADYDRIDDNKQGILRIILKYDVDGQPVISRISRVSRPGCRKYSTVDELPHVMSGMGIAVVSTSKGIMSDRDCRQNRVGGELICVVN